MGSEMIMTDDRPFFVIILTVIGVIIAIPILATALIMYQKRKLRRK
jgi:hypothetical protein